MSFPYSKFFCEVLFFYGDTPALASPFFPSSNHFSLAFFISSFANLHSSSYHSFLNVSVPSSFSVSCCLVSLIVILIFSHFSLILLLILSSVSKFSSISNYY